MPKKIKCEFCDSEIDQNAKICPICDSVRIHTCFFCDAVIEDYHNTKTCPSCGKPYISYLKPKDARPDAKYTKEEGRKAIEYALARAMEVNQSEEHIYHITKLVVFGSYLDKTKEFIRNVNLAVYFELKDTSENPIDQNENLYFKDLYAGKTERLSDLEESWYYGHRKMFNFLKGDMEFIHLHEGHPADEMAKVSGTENYIYIGNYVVFSLSDD